MSNEQNPSTPNTPEVLPETIPTPPKADKPGKAKPVLSEADAYRAKLAALRAEHPETVEIRLPLDKKNPSPLLVSVNGRRFGIQRGKSVTVPYEVAAVVERSAAQDEHVINLINGLVDAFEAQN